MTVPALGRGIAALATICIVLSPLASRPVGAQAGKQAVRTFATPEDATRALIEIVKKGDLNELLAILGPGSQDLVSSSDPVTARQNRQIFVVAAREGWRLETDSASRRTLVVGNEDWPFPVPLVKDGSKWRFDGAAGKEEVLARRIGRNELAAIGTCLTYVTAQRRYAQDGHDGKPAGVYAAAFRSDQGKQNGLYWPSTRGQKISPLGDLVAQAAADGRTAATSGQPPAPFHGYYFRILTGQGASVPGGARSYLINGAMSGGFALVAWPAQYDASGVMTFVVNQDGKVHQKDLGPGTDAAARAMTVYNPDKTWTEVQ